MDDLLHAQAMLKKARSETWRMIYEEFEDAKFREKIGKELPTLSDEELALCKVTAEQIFTKLENIRAELPSSVDFDGLVNIKTTKSDFFKGFLLVTRKPIDGILIGFGNDDIYYVLVTWDWNGPFCWKPKVSLYGDPIIT